MKLYSHPLSGHSHRARLFLSLIDLPYDLVDIDLANRGHKQPEFLALNRLGQVPVLDDDGVVVADSNAILVYLAKKAGRSDWLPESPAAAAAVQRWLSVAAGQIANGPAAARLVNVFGSTIDARAAIERAHAIISPIDAELAGREWIATEQPTIADVALYSYIANAPEGDVDLAGYSNVQRWLRRIEALPGFVPFQKTKVGLAA